MKRFDKYINDVINNKIIVGNLIKLAVKRHLKDLENKKFVFDRVEAQRIVSFFEICRHWKGQYSGQRIKLQPHQIFHNASLFAWKLQNDKRRFNTSYMEVARKNGKTTEAAVRIIYHILADQVQGSQALSAATAEAQARIVINDAANIIKITPELNEKFRLFKFKDMYNRIVYFKTSSFAAPISKESKSQEGTDPTYGVIDEYHLHKNDDLVDVLESGMGSRENPIMDIITTAGFNKNLPCYKLREIGIDILKGRLKDESFLVIIHAVDEKNDWKDKKTWLKANPNLGQSVRMDYLEKRFIKAKNQGGTKEIDFKTKNLNIWTNASEVWVQDEMWQKNTHGIKLEELEGQRCYGGLDLGKTSDLNAFILLFPDINGKMAVLALFYMPEFKILNSSDRVDYVRWVEDGYIRTTAGKIVDHRFLAEDIANLCKKYDVRSICYDTYIATHGTVQRLRDEGIKMNDLRQGFLSLSTPTKELESLILCEKLEHFNNPVMRWMLGNVQIATDPAGNIKPDKGNSRNKIDGIAALVNALADKMEFDVEGAVYENNDLLIL